MESWKRTFASAWVAQVLSIMGFSFVLPFLPLFIRDSLHVVNEGEIARWAGWASAAAGLSMAVFAPIWGGLADRYGRKPMVLRAMFGGAGVLCLMAFSRNVTDLLVLRFLQGMLTGTATANIAMVSSVAPKERVGFALGMMQAAIFFGGSAGPFVGGEVAERFGFRAAFLVSAVMLLAAGALVKMFAEDRFTPPVRVKGGGLGGFGAVFAPVGFMAALLTLFQVHFANSAFAPVFPLFVEGLNGTADGAKALTGRIMGVAGLAAALTAGMLGRLSDRWGHKRVLTFSTLIAGLVTLPVAFVHSIPQLYTLRILFGLAAAGIMPSANAIIRRIMPEQHLGKAYGVTASVTCLGWGLGPLMGGYVAEHTTIREPFILTAAILLATTLLVIWQIRPDPLRPSAAPEPAASKAGASEADA